MRHTLTLEPDVDAALEQVCKETGDSYKAVVNSVLRQGLIVRERSKNAPPLQISPLAMGLQRGLSLDSVSTLESIIEEEQRR